MQRGGREPTKLEQANILVSLAVAPQLILGGGMAPKPPAAAEWMANGLTSIQHVRVLVESQAGLLQGDLGWTNGPALFAQAVAMLIVAWWRSLRIRT